MTSKTTTFVTSISDIVMKRYVDEQTGEEKMIFQRNALSERRYRILFYYIQSSEIQGNIIDIYCIFYIFTSENIKSYIFTPPECTYIFFLDNL